VLGVSPQRGRVFNAELDKPGDTPVVVISNRFWRNRLQLLARRGGTDASPEWTARNHRGYHSEEFQWRPLHEPRGAISSDYSAAALAPELAKRRCCINAMPGIPSPHLPGPGVTIDSAEAALDTITRQLDEQDPSAPARADKGRRVTLLWRAPWYDSRNLKPVVIGFYVVLDGADYDHRLHELGNMLLARGPNRRKELAIRLAIGAGRFRLVGR